MKKIIFLVAIFASTMNMVACATKSMTTTEQKTESVETISHQDVKGEIAK